MSKLLKKPSALKKEHPADPIHPDPDPKPWSTPCLHFLVPTLLAYDGDKYLIEPCERRFGVPAQSQLTTKARCPKIVELSEFY
jgi:hypothetical protein